ncbi:hypothetical protein LX99_04044 [Mucilaginibacter oryzae]|uniref:Uncharacterized protein n=1 Tax=Mucilaginibacter oryzae TaxID=468058 RepID=A0A316H2F0_9SPHI|nr:hypothetical protein [Mucilaginibacter oryzae]PWK74242.1 hypothetical protein LX99_04044 [Mucilaginibacter oryzae]
MKKAIILLFILSVAFTKSHAQQLVPDDQFSTLIGFLNEENWPGAAKLSDDILKNIPKNRQDDDGPAVVRYMHIIAEAGLMYMGKATKEEALKNVEGFTGHLIITPSRFVALKYGLNRIVSSEDKPGNLGSSCTNRKGTDLYTSESIILAQPITAEEFKTFEGKLFRIGGVLKSISVAGSMLPHFNIEINEAILEPGDKE